MSGNPHVPGNSGHPFVGKGSVTSCPGCDLGIVALEADTLGVITGGGGGDWEEEGRRRGRRRVRTMAYCGCLKHKNRTNPSSFLSSFNSLLHSLRPGQDRSLTEQECSGNALLIC